MRYRPFGHFNVSVSAVSLVLEDDDRRSADAWTALIYAALENGINGFEMRGRQPALIEGLNRAFKHVERRLVFVAWRIGPTTIPPQYADQAFQPKLVQASVQSALARTGLEYLDLALLDDPGEHDLPATTLQALKDMKTAGQVRLIGVAGENPAIEAYISTRQFDVVGLPFSIASGWRDRLRLRAAQERDMAVIGYNFCPPELRQAAPAAHEVKRGLWGKKVIQKGPADAYDFLNATPGWTREEICLAFALTEPSLATIEIAPDNLETLIAFASVTDREMPAGLSATIEMARVMVNGGDQQPRSA